MKKKLVTFLAALALMPLALPAQAHSPESYYGGYTPGCVYIEQASYQSSSSWNPLNKGQATIDAVTAAIAVINSQPSRYAFTYCGLTTNVSGAWQTVLTYRPSEVGDGGLAVAHTVFANGYVIGAEIKFNDRNKFCYQTCSPYHYWRINNTYANGTANWNDFQYALTHELLHILGQPHVTNAYHTMQASAGWARNSTAGRSLETHDVDWINTQQ